MISANIALLGTLLVPVLAASPDAGSDRADSLRLAKVWNASAENYMAQGAYEEARRLYLQSLPVLEEALGSEHPATVTTLGNLCGASSHLSAYLDAKPLCLRALALREKVFGPIHADVARSLSDLGILYTNEGDFTRAESFLRRALEIGSSSADSEDLPGLLNNLGFLYAKRRKYSRAEELFESAITQTERRSCPEDPGLLTMLSNVATVYLADHRFRIAEERFRRALAIAESSSTANSLNSLQALIGLTRAEAALGKGTEAQTFLERARMVVAHNRQPYLQWENAIEAMRPDLFNK